MERAASTREMTAVIKTVRLGASACVAALALALTCGVASAQLQKAPETKKVEPAAKAAEPAKKVEPAAKPAEAVKKPVAKVVCAGTPDETACKANNLAAAKSSLPDLKNQYSLVVEALQQISLSG